MVVEGCSPVPEVPGAAGCSVVVAGALTGGSVLPPNHPPYQPMTASRMTIAITIDALLPRPDALSFDAIFDLPKEMRLRSAQPRSLIVIVEINARNSAIRIDSDQYHPAAVMNKQ